MIISSNPDRIDLAPADRLEPGAAEAVQPHAGDRVGHPGRWRRCGRCPCPGVHRRHAAQDHVGDPLLVQIGEPAPKLVDQADDQIDRLHAVQCACCACPCHGGWMASKMKMEKCFIQNWKIKSKTIMRNQCFGWLRCCATKARSGQK